MDGTTIDTVIFAPLAPILGVLLFWFVQLLFIESQKFLLEKIRPRHEPFCRFTNFLGVFFQTICHALGYTVTKSGISDFYISVSYGRVAPKKEKKGIFEWVANFFLFVGPFFIPAFLILLCLFLLGIQGFDVSTPTHVADLKYTFGGQITAFGANLYRFSSGFFTFLANIDLLHPGHFGFLILMIFLGLGIRPSHIGEQKIDKVDMVYDLRNIWRLITSRKRYILLLFIIGYIFFHVSYLLNLNGYVILFSIFGWLSIISIVSLIITHLLLLLIKTTDEIEGKRKYLPYISLPISYILMRLLFHYIKTEYDLSSSMLVMLFSTVLLTIYIKKGKTNKFKFKLSIKLFSRKKKEKDDE